VEVAHEALIREWPTLRGWLEEDREGLRLHRHLTLAADAWEQNNRDASELYRGTRLTQALAWAAVHANDLNESEQAFLDLSRTLAEQEEAAREAQYQRELKAAQTLAETQQRAATQLRRRAYYLSGAFILALIMAGVALFLGEQARQSAITAQNAQRITYARELAGAALNNLEIDPERSILLALQAVSTTRMVDGTVLPEAEEALHRSLLASPVRLTLTGHEIGVLTAAFSPDGQRIATIGRDGVTIIWDANTGSELLRLPGTTQPGDAISAQRLAFSPDGRWLATADDSLIRLWGVTSGDLIRTFSGHSGEVWAIAFSPDGSQLASGGADAQAYIWDVNTGATQFELTAHTEAIEELAFSPDGRWLVTTSDDLSMKVWEAASGALLQDISDLTVPAYSIAFSPDSSRMATDNMIWDTRALPFTLASTIPENIGAVVFSPDGHWLAGSSGSIAKVLDAATGQPLLTLAGHTSWIIDVAFSPDGERLTTTSLDGTAKVWSLTPGYEVVTVAGKGWRVAFSADGTQLAMEGLDGTASIWDAATGNPIRDLEGHTQSLLNVAYDPTGHRLATGSFDATAKIWDTDTGVELLTLTGHELGIRDLAFSPDGSRIATASFDMTARVWDALTGETLLTLKGHEGGVVGVAYSPNGKWIATSSLDSTAKLWDAETGQLLFTLKGHTAPIPDIAFSPDSSKVITGGQDAIAQLWDTATGKELLTLTGHSAEIQSVAFSPDGQLIATGSGDNTAKVWEAETGRELLTLPGSIGGVAGVAFNPKSSEPQLAVASPNGVVRVFLVKIEDVLTLSKLRLTRSLTLAECQKYLHLQECP
jgi:WD40 repeat protein